jgi:hypothetical protein
MNTGLAELLPDGIRFDIVEGALAAADFEQRLVKEPIPAGLAAEPVLLSGYSFAMAQITRAL